MHKKDTIWLGQLNIVSKLILNGNILLWPEHVSESRNLLLKS